MCCCVKVPFHIRRGRNLHFPDVKSQSGLHPENLLNRDYSLSIKSNSCIEDTAGIRSSANPTTLYLTSRGGSCGNFNSRSRSMEGQTLGSASCIGSEVMDQFHIQTNPLMEHLPAVRNIANDQLYILLQKKRDIEKW
jgi:hypothetical protein